MRGPQRIILFRMVMVAVLQSSMVFLYFMTTTGVPTSAWSFSPRLLQQRHRCRTDDTVLMVSRTTTTCRIHAENDVSNNEAPPADIISRRSMLLKTASSSSSFSTLGLGMLISPSIVAAEDGTAATTAPSVEMKNFIDPAGFFTIRVPQSFFTLRRSSKGDLPDPKTGQGRRGSSIFTAGDLQKAEVIAVERFPTRVLLEENGIDTSAIAADDLSTFPKLGEPNAIANLLNLRRDRDKGGNTVIVPNSLFVSSDKKELYFQLRTEIEVQKPELLLEQTGSSQLFRITVAKASLKSNDGNIMAVFASALEKGALTLALLSLRTL